MRNDNNIKDIYIDGEEYRLIQYADETTFILDSTSQSLENNDFARLLFRYFWFKNQLHQVLKPYGDYFIEVRKENIKNVF